MSQSWTPSPRAKQLNTYVVFVWAGLFFFSITRHFIAHDFLYALAWKYSAFITIPLGILWAARVWNSAELRQKLGKRFWISALLLPLITYFIIGLSILKIPASLLYFAPITLSTEIVTFEEGPGQCRSGSFAVREYPSLLQACIFLGGEDRMQLKSGDTIQLEGKKGLGGFLVERYVGYRKAGAANNSLQPTGYADG